MSVRWVFFVRWVHLLLLLISCDAHKTRTHRNVNETNRGKKQQADHCYRCEEKRFAAKKKINQPASRSGKTRSVLDGLHTPERTKLKGELKGACVCVCVTQKRQRQWARNHSRPIGKSSSHAHTQLHVQPSTSFRGAE